MTAKDLQTLNFDLIIYGFVDSQVKQGVSIIKQTTVKIIGLGVTLLIQRTIHILLRDDSKLSQICQVKLTVHTVHK